MHGKLTSTYKAVFLRALTDIGRYEEAGLVGREWMGHRNTKTVLELDFIAVRFIKYYRDMDVSFAMQHLVNRSSDGKKQDGDKIVSLIEEEIKAVQGSNAGPEIDLYSKPPTLEDLASERAADLRGKVIKLVLKKHVLDAVLTDMNGLIDKVGDRYIEFDSALIEFMKKYSTIIKHALNYVIAKKLEKSNREARYIALKIDHELTFEKRLELIEKLVQKTGQKPEVC